MPEAMCLADGVPNEIALLNNKGAARDSKLPRLNQRMWSDKRLRVEMPRDQTKSGGYCEVRSFYDSSGLCR